MLNLFQHLINCCFMFPMKITKDSSDKWTLIVIRLSFNFYTARSNFVTDLAYLYFKRATGTFKTEFL